MTPQSAYIVTDILAGNTDPQQNPFWGKFELTDANGTRRPAAFKTGTNNDAKDLTAAGYVAPPDQAGRDNHEYALVATAWAGNSDGSFVSTPDNPVFSIDVTAPMWQGFMDETTKTWPIKDFARPGGLVNADVDAWSGGKPTQFTTKTVKEIFIEGTAPALTTRSTSACTSSATRPAPSTCGTRAAPACPRRRVSSTSRRSSRTNRSGSPPTTTGSRALNRASASRAAPTPNDEDSDQLLLQLHLPPVRQELGCAVPAGARLQRPAIADAAAVHVADPDDRPVRLAVPGLPVAVTIALAVAQPSDHAEPTDDHARSRPTADTPPPTDTPTPPPTITPTPPPTLPIAAAVRCAVALTGPGSHTLGPRALTAAPSVIA